MTRLYARALKGKRAHGARPDKRGKNITIIGAIATREIVGAMSFKGGNHKNAFKTYINQVLVSLVKESIRPMKPPRCTPYPPAARYKRVVVRSLWYDADGLTVEVQGPGFVLARVVFRRPAGFRVLDERDLCEFWDSYHAGNGWLYEVHEGGWQELESHRQDFNSPLCFTGLREFLVVCDQCVSVLSVEPPELINLGANPEHPLAD